MHFEFVSQNSSSEMRSIESNDFLDEIMNGEKENQGYIHIYIYIL